MDLGKYIRNVPDWPKPGVQFKDLTTLWKDPDAFRESIDILYKRYNDRNIKKIVGAESRGFIVASPLAYLLSAGFIPVRKKGKLPYKTKSVTYELEYGTDTLEMHEDAIKSGMRVLIIDDLLATGGTVKGVTDLINNTGGTIVGIAFLIELKFLKGIKKLQGYPAYSLIKYYSPSPY